MYKRSRPRYYCVNNNDESEHLMFMNLHTLPAGQAMFTATLMNGPDDEYPEEFDFVAGTRLEPMELRELAAEKVREEYMAGYDVVGIVNQSEGFVVADWRGELFA